ncbi:MAG: low specificity L-threonine aldolase [Hyphomicrobiales bacterium]|nr:low specificity L-threonine aldolase [Hyphomicrobiales bacterium]
MRFASDNASGMSQPIMEALEAAHADYAMPYGADDYTRAAEDALEETFEHECAVFFVPTGTAANALALASICKPWGAIFAHHDAHVMDDECGAPEFFTLGAKMVGVAGAKGLIDPAALRSTLADYPHGLVKQVQPAALSLSQATESGTVYRLKTLMELSAIAHEGGLHVHMDGARFANALVKLKAAPADMTWRAGVDVLSFGATKNGTMMCEAVIFFNRDLAKDFLYRRKRGGHTVSKARFLGAQMLAYLNGGHWLELAGRANGMAARLARGLKQIKGVRLPWPVDVNEVFAILPGKVDKALKEAGALYYNWSPVALEPRQQPKSGEVFVRLVTSFATRPEDVDRFLETAQRASR